MSSANQPFRETTPGVARRPRLLFVVTEDWYFASHRLALARRAREAGYDVAVACRAGSSVGSIRAEQFHVLPLCWRRRARSPISLLRAVLELREIYRTWRPDVIHHVALMPVVLGSLAAGSVPQTGIVNAINGLGFLFTDRSPKARVIRRLVGPVLRRLLARANSVTLVQNDDDARFLRERRYVEPGRLVVVRGSGVDLEAFKALPPSDEDPPAAALVGRMLEMKGIETAVSAFEQLAERGVPVRLLLVGDPDAANPTSIPEDRLRALNNLPNVEWLGHVDDVRSVWRRAALCLQPSLGGEGVPKSLLEAAACRRGAIASDVPGCRDVVRPGENGLLVPPGDAAALADAVEQAFADRGRLETWGRASRKRVASAGFDEEAVCEAVLELYSRVAPVKEQGRPDGGRPRRIGRLSV